MHCRFVVFALLFVIAGLAAAAHGERQALQTLQVATSALCRV